MKHLLPAIRIYLFLTLLVGVLYPAVVTIIGQLAFPNQANGSFIESHGQLVGSELIAQKFENEKYFWPRPSAIDFNPLSSGGSNLGPTSSGLKEAFESRAAKLGKDAPQDLLFASASGLDPDLSTEGALFQIPRVAKARGVPEETLRRMVLDSVHKRQLGFLGEDTVNVLKINIALDEKR